MQRSFVAFTSDQARDHVRTGTKSWQRHEFRGWGRGVCGGKTGQRWFSCDVLPETYRGLNFAVKLRCF